MAGPASPFVADSGATQDFAASKFWSGLKANAIAAGIDHDPRPLRAQRQTSWARDVGGDGPMSRQCKGFPWPSA
jgi:hypothetical protein